MAPVDRPREIIINQALTQPDHLWGVERQLVLVFVVITIAMVALASGLWPRIVALVIWFGAYACLKMMADTDPLMSKVYIRHIQYKKYYTAQSSPYSTYSKSYKG